MLAFFKPAASPTAYFFQTCPEDGPRSLSHSLLSEFFKRKLRNERRELSYVLKSGVLHVEQCHRRIGRDLILATLIAESWSDPFSIFSLEL